jgi:hypothetical protein
MIETPWSFVAMEYYALILNRTYFLTVDTQHLEGKVCRGLTSVEGGAGLTRVATSQLAVHGQLTDPKSYIDNRLLAKSNKANFAVALSDIFSVEYTPKMKWGMGYYPHDGRVFVETAKRKRELIILGNQSGQEIASRLRANAEHARIK